MLPTTPTGEWLVGSAARCHVRLVDPQRFVSRQHARLVRHETTWTLADLGSKNGLWFDNERHPIFVLAPGTEVGIGSFRLVAESQRVIALRAFLCRIIGWSDARAKQVDRALRSMRDLATRRAPLILRGEGDLVPVARALHRRAFGDARPFVVNDPRALARRDAASEVDNVTAAGAAADAARGGTLCILADRSALAMAAVRDLAADPTRQVGLIICARPTAVIREIAGQTITLPSLSERTDELEQLIDAYAEDAIASLGARPASYTAIEAVRTLNRRPRTLSELETTVTRLIAIREYGGVTRAAARLGISHVALSRWLSRRP